MNEEIELKNLADSIMYQPQDNLKAAMDKETETTLKDMAVSTTASDGDGPADKQVLIRATEADKERWKRAAEVKGLTMSDFIRGTLNDAAAGTLDCNHPINQRRYYPWAEFCLACNVRLRG